MTNVPWLSRCCREHFMTYEGKAIYRRLLQGMFSFPV